MCTNSNECIPQLLRHDILLVPLYGMDIAIHVRLVARSAAQKLAQVQQGYLHTRALDAGRNNTRQFG